MYHRGVDNLASQKSPPYKLTRWSRQEPPTREELEEKLRREGIEPAYWNEPAGSHYPVHTHRNPELRWVIAGELRF